MKNIILFGAHSDDQVLGAGGTLAKLAEEGYNIHIVIFSHGEKSHPWMKKSYIKQLRIKESESAGVVLGTKSLTFLGINEGKFNIELKRRDIRQMLTDMMVKKKPEMIFVHSSDDPHVDHREVNKIILELYDKCRCKADVYMFDIWNIFSVNKRQLPQLIVDIRKQFGKKREALRCFKSQKLAMLTLLWSVYAKSFISGWKINTLFAERFYKIR